MTRRGHRFLLYSATILPVACGPLSAQDGEDNTYAYDPAALLVANVRRSSSQEAHLNTLLESFREVDSDGNGLDRDDVARLEERMLARVREQHAQTLARVEQEFMRYDTDGDGGVTKAEMLAAIEYEQSGRADVDREFERRDADGDGRLALAEVAPRGGAQAEQFAAIDTDGDAYLSKEELHAALAARNSRRDPPDFAFERLDADGNGSLTIEEVAGLEGPPMLDARRQERKARAFERLFAIDANGDGILSEAEFSEAFRRQFAAIDTDGNQLISAAEFDGAQERLAMARDIAEAPLCTVPGPRNGTRALAFIAGRGELVSPVALGAQDRTTSIIKVAIDSGDEPLFLLLAADDPVIWDFSGATERLERVVLFADEHDDAGHALAGALGLPQSKVTFGEPGCFPAGRMASTGSRSEDRLANHVGAVTGISARVRPVPGAAGTVTFPAMVVEQLHRPVPAPDGFDPDIWWEAIAAHPRGVGDPELASLVTQTALVEYEWLPGEFGLAQMAAQEMIEPTDNHGEYRLLHQMSRFPEAFETLRSVDFVLGEGIRRPDGEFGTGCLFAADGETVLEGEHCFQSLRADAVQVRYDESGQSCLFRSRTEKAGCFPEDGRPLRAVDTPQGQQFMPVSEEEAGVPEITTERSIPGPALSPVEIIPTGGR
ncbi:hypothetical protein [Alteraurantiacibacter aquimixticola]|uniref:EF-hand domain-containing protein n=1 Tax=Alteraurantiacibacter aquimixticola TaxID=2489173 RepID=A0A4T3F667_9SPHN|nr:hypothetical protein [Alteraurantiacibacter aquimixticola]TIX51142.1 hypothetical protein E5222_01285 [Alteraurantiacibacter aquimixticola]